MRIDANEALRQLKAVGIDARLNGNKITAGSGWIQANDNGMFSQMSVTWFARGRLNPNDVWISPQDALGMCQDAGVPASYSAGKLTVDIGTIRIYDGTEHKLAQAGKVLEHHVLRSIDYFNVRNGQCGL